MTLHNAGQVEAAADELQIGIRDQAAVAGRPKSAGLSPAIVSGIVGISDVVIIFGVGLGLYFGYVDWVPGDLSRYLANLTSNAVLTVGLFYIFGLYNFDAILAPGSRLGKVAGICVFVFMLMVVWAFALKISLEFSRVWFFASLVGETALICLFRVSVRSHIHGRARAGEISRRIAVVGDTMQAARFISTVQSSDTPWNEVIGVFDDRQDSARSNNHAGAGQVLGGIKELVRYARSERVDDVVIALPWNAVDRLLSMIEQLRELPVNVRLAVDMIHYEFPDREATMLAGVPLLDVAPKPLADWSVVVKMIEDKVLAALALILFGPLMLLIAVAIKLDSPGPVLFRQGRYGFNNQLIEIYKFRTMHHAMRDDDAVQLTTRHDPRVTRLGAFLRRVSLDELAQIFNVLKGDMSMVGPRPHARSAKAGTRLYPEVVDQYAARHKVKPGITGWAQVNGWRGETDTEDKIIQRVQHDVYYIENWSLWLDIRILLKTAAVGFSGKNAF